MSGFVAFFMSRSSFCAQYELGLADVGTKDSVEDRVSVQVEFFMEFWTRMLELELVPARLSA